MICENTVPDVLYCCQAGKNVGIVSYFVSNSDFFMMLSFLVGVCQCIVTFHGFWDVLNPAKAGYVWDIFPYE